MSAWPFLISASRDLDYRIVLCPDFLLTAEKSHVILKAFARKIEDVTKDIVLHEISDKRLGEMGFAYKVDVARSNGKALRDRSGRQIHRAYGVLFRGLDSNSQRELAVRAFPEAESIVDEAYAQFLTVKDEFQPWQSHPLGEQSVTPRKVEQVSQAPEKVEEPLPNKLPVKPLAIVALCVLGMSLTTNIVLLWQMREARQERRVSALDRQALGRLMLLLSDQERKDILDRIGGRIEGTGARQEEAVLERLLRNLD